MNETEHKGYADGDDASGLVLHGRFMSMISLPKFDVPTLVLHGEHD